MSAQPGLSSPKGEKKSGQSPLASPNRDKKRKPESPMSPTFKKLQKEDEISTILTEGNWDALKEGVRHLEFAKGESILKKGDLVEGLYQVVSGDVVVTDAAGAVQCTFAAQHVFGDLEFLCSLKAESPISAGENGAVVALLEESYLQSLMAECPKIPARFYCFLAMELASRLRAATVKEDAKDECGQRKAPPSEGETRAAVFKALQEMAASGGAQPANLGAVREELYTRDWRRLLHVSSVFTLDKGTVVLRQGEEVEALYQVSKGKLVAERRHGDEIALMEELDEEDVFGELEFLDGGQAVCAVTALVDGTQVHVMPYPNIESTLNSGDPLLCLRFYKFLARELAMKLRFTSSVKHPHVLAARVPVLSKRPKQA